MLQHVEILGVLSPTRMGLFMQNWAMPEELLQTVAQSCDCSIASLLWTDSALADLPGQLSI